eukprot:gene3176-6267_t
MSTYPINRVHDILRRMEDNSAQSEAMKTCFGILAIMSREDANKLTIARDGMDAILNAMTAHVDKVDVQEAGCDLLWSLAFNHSMAKEIIGKQGGIGVLVRALKRHSRSADFLKSACGALSNLCQSKINQQSVASQGGLQPLVGAIHIHSANARLLPFLFDALAALIVSNEDNARSVSSLGGVPLVIAALARHKSVPEVVKSGCHSLAILSDVKGQASKIAFAGGVPTILPILDCHPSYADLHRVAAVVLLRMLQESSHVSREISCHEGIRILLKSLEKGGAQQDTVAAVTHILYTVTNPSSPSSSAIEAQLWHPVSQETIDRDRDRDVSTSIPLSMSTDSNSKNTVTNGAISNGRNRSRFSREVMSLDAATNSSNGANSSARDMAGGGSLQIIRAPQPTVGGGGGGGSGGGEGSNNNSNNSKHGGPSSPVVTVSAQSTLGGLVDALAQYRDRRDVARAGCRLLTNLLHFPGVALALDKLHVMDRAFESVSVHSDTRDVLESASAVMKAIHKKVVPSFSGNTAAGMKGILTIFRSKIADDEVVTACAEILAKHVMTVQKDKKGLREEFRTEDGRTWENEAMSLGNKALQRLVGLDYQDSVATETSTALATATTATTTVSLPSSAVVLASSSSSTSLSLLSDGNGNGNGSNKPPVKRGQWFKTSANVLNSLLNFVEAVCIASSNTTTQQHPSLSQDSSSLSSLMFQDTFNALQSVCDNIPPKHSELCRRIDKLLPILNPAEYKDFTKNKRLDLSQLQGGGGSNNNSSHNMSNSPTGHMSSAKFLLSRAALLRSNASEEDLASQADKSDTSNYPDTLLHLRNKDGSSSNTNNKGIFDSLTDENSIGFSVTGLHIDSSNTKTSGKTGGGGNGGGRQSISKLNTNSSKSSLAKDQSSGNNNSNSNKRAQKSNSNSNENIQFTRVEYIDPNGKNIKRLLPQHPLKYRTTHPNQQDSGKLIDTWPNFLERLLVPSMMPGNIPSSLSLPFDSIGMGAVPERMSLCYEGASAAGKDVQSRCPTPVPYNVATEGGTGTGGGSLGEPFEHSLTFDSEFESGNLLRAVQRGDACYDLFLRADLHTTGHTQWFYFAVANTHPPAVVRLAEQGVQVPPVRVKFNIVNLTKPDSLFNLGMRPVMYSCEDAARKSLGWVRTGSDISYYINPFNRNNTAGEGVACYYTLSFTIEFHNPKDTYLIAYTYPYTYEDYKLHLSSILDRPGSADVIRHGRLCVTLGGNDCDLLVITNFKDKASIGSLGINTTEPKEDPKRRNDSDNKQSSTSASRSSGCKQPKKCLVISGRVHPGETPASWMMKGILDFLTSSTPAAELLRQVFVIFIIPMLNPDGVSYGNNRCCLAGVDLNRQWKKPVRSLHPNVFYLKNFMKIQRGMRDVTMYIDLHGHSRKYNVFMYGCDDKKRAKSQVRAFPKFFSMHSAGKKYVSFQDCSFHVKKGRESTARVVVAKELNIPLSYTLEATFCGSNYGPLKHCHMNIGHLQEVGSAMCDAILNFCIAEGQVKDTLLVPGATIPFTNGFGFGGMSNLHSLLDQDTRDNGIDSNARLMGKDDDDSSSCYRANSGGGLLSDAEGDNDNDNEDIDNDNDVADDADEGSGSDDQQETAGFDTDVELDGDGDGIGDVGTGTGFVDVTAQKSWETLMISEDASSGQDTATGVGTGVGTGVSVSVSVSVSGEISSRTKSIHVAGKARPYASVKSFRNDMNNNIASPPTGFKAAHSARLSSARDDVFGLQDIATGVSRSGSGQALSTAGPAFGERKSSSTAPSDTEQQTNAMTMAMTTLSDDKYRAAMPVSRARKLTVPRRQNDEIMFLSVTSAAQNNSNSGNTNIIPISSPSMFGGPSKHTSHNSNIRGGSNQQPNMEGAGPVSKGLPRVSRGVI